jgi:hypothetical protein
MNLDDMKITMRQTMTVQRTICENGVLMLSFRILCVNVRFRTDNE